jgi:hypothetical protein
MSSLIQYKELRDLLSTLEMQIADSTDSGFRSAGEIRTIKSQVQGYALNKSMDAACKTVVVAVGGNYTQANVNTPRDEYHAPDSVEADLSANRRLLSIGFDSYNNNKALWEEKCAVFSQSAVTPNEFHFVMTNFCIWITKRSWQNVSPHARADLLENNPLLGVKSTVLGCWAHLSELAKILDGSPVLWVAHGMHCEVFTLFRQFIRSLPGAQWMLIPNLSYYYNYDEWTFLR